MKDIHKFNTMTYNQFISWCNERACDGNWTFYEALSYSTLATKINNVKVKGIFNRAKRIDAAKEHLWKLFLSEFFSD